MMDLWGGGCFKKITSRFNSVIYKFILHYSNYELFYFQGRVNGIETYGLIKHFY